MTDQQAIDREVCTAIWYMFRDYGDITNTKKDERRWEEVVEAADALGRKYRWSRRLIAETLMQLENRARKNVSI